MSGVLGMLKGRRSTHIIPEDDSVLGVLGWHGAYQGSSMPVSQLSWSQFLSFCT